MRWLATLALASVIAGCASLPAAPAPPLWQIEGERNRVYLLGSIHLLRPSDYPLPPIFDYVYDDAEQLVMELDMDDLDPALVQRTMLQLGIDPNGRRLPQLLGEQAWQKAVALSAGLVTETAGGVVSTGLSTVTVTGAEVV